MYAVLTPHTLDLHGGGNFSGETPQEAAFCALHSITHRTIATALTFTRVARFTPSWSLSLPPFALFIKSITAAQVDALTADRSVRLLPHSTTLPPYDTF